MALSNKRYVYLAGKIKIGHGATGYRAIIAPILQKFGLYSLDPLRGKYNLPNWLQLDANEVVVRDLQDIQRSHVVIAVMMKCEDSSFGTPCEIMYAWQRQIPVVLITDEKYLAEHFWTRSLCSRVRLVLPTENLDDVLVEIAQQVGYWYGADAEEEVYAKPELVQKLTPVMVDNCPGGCGQSVANCECLGHSNERIQY
jgi:nucleoside 2-deoxyribosyltransferase